MGPAQNGRGWKAGESVQYLTRRQQPEFKKREGAAGRKRGDMQITLAIKSRVNKPCRTPPCFRCFCNEAVVVAPLAGLLLPSFFSGRHSRLLFW